MTYKKVQSIYKTKHGKTVKSCWIASIKRELNLTTRKAYNRLHNDKVKYPCPEGEIKQKLTEIIKTIYNI